MTVYYGRASASPGKHGAGDLRVELNGIAPSLPEILWALGAILIAEDRYSGPGTLGRYLTWYYVDQLQGAKNLDRVAEIADDARDAKFNAPRLINGAPPSKAMA